MNSLPFRNWAFCKGPRKFRYVKKCSFPKKKCIKFHQQLRSFTIATYAICGFANPGSMGIVIGSYSALCPEKKTEIVSVVFRAFLSGTAVCLITASIAGKWNHLRFSYRYLKATFLGLLITDDGSWHDASVFQLIFLFVLEI